MWDPDYVQFLQRVRLQTGRRSPTDFDVNGEEEDSDYVLEEEEDSNGDDGEEDEEDGDGDSEDSVPGRTLVHAMTDRNGDHVLPAAAPSSSQEVVVVDDSPSDDDGDDAVAEVERQCSSPREGGKGVLTASPKSDDDKLLGEFNRGEIDGLFCPICFEAWSNGGDHRVCCLPCGHMFGQSCIKKWLGRQGTSKCPQCKRKCRIKDIRLLYATKVIAIDEALQKKSQLFEAKCASLEKKSTEWVKKEVEWKKREADLCNQVEYLKERTHDLEELLEDMERKASGSPASNLNCPGGVDSSPTVHSGGSHKFQMQKEFQIQGARLFGSDSFSKTLLFARRLSGRAGAHVLTKVSLFSDHEREDIHLDENTKAVKDLQVSPYGGGLVLLASLGKKLSVLSTKSNNAVITYNLPAAAWSCSWDIFDSHYLYAGLQNGTVIQFDTRQTARHVESLTVMADKLVHTLHSLPSSACPGARSVLSASAHGLCQLNFGGSEERPYLIPESDKQGVCISLAHSNSSDYYTASYRPKIELGGNVGVSQPTLTAAAAGQTTMGSHILYCRNGATYQKVGATSAYVSDIRVPIRSAVIDGVYRNSIFASVDESTSEVVFQELPSLRILDRLEPQNCPIYDVKYSRMSSSGSGVLGCLSDNSFRLYRADLV